MQPRTNRFTSPSFELTGANMTSGSAGTTTGLTFNLSSPDYYKYGTKSGMVQQNNVAQYYFNTPSAMTYTTGVVYCFSAYVFIPTGSTLTSIQIGIRDYSSYNWLMDYKGVSSATKTFALTPNTWTRIWTATIGGATTTLGAASANWRLTIADAGGRNASAQSIYADGIMFEEGVLTPGDYFDGNNNGGAWTGTVNLSTSIKRDVGRAFF